MTNIDVLILYLGTYRCIKVVKPAAFYEGVCIDNISPFGVWELQLHPWIVWKDATAQKLNSGVLKEKIRDLKLMFRVYSPAKATA